MPIQIPFHSQAAPGVVPNAGARAMPGGFGSLQQAAKMPLNDQRATADMFSGGLQGLQGLGQALGNVGQGFFQIAAKMRQLDDYQIKTDEMEAGAALDYGMAEATAEFKNDPDGLQLRYDELNQQYRAAVLDRDMPADVRAELERKVLLRTSSDKTNMLVNRLEDKMSQASTRAGTSIMKNVADGNTPGAHAAIDLAVEGGVMDAATGERLHLVEGQKSEYNRFVKDADAAADDLSGERPVELNIDNYGLSEEQRSRAGVYQQRAQNKAENRLLEQMISSPDDFTAEVVDDLVQRKYMEPSTAARWKDSLTKAPLPPDSPEVQAVWRMVNSYVPGADSDTLEARNAIMIEMSAISPRASESVALMRTALGNRVGGYEKMLEITLERFEKTIKALDDNDNTLSTERENTLYNRMADEIRALSKQRPEATAEELYEQSKVKFEVFKNKPVKEIKSNPEKVKVSGPRSASGAFSADPRTRDVIRKRSTEGARQVSLDFNDTDGAGGKASYSTIVIPDDATNEERVTAMAYTAKVTEFFAKYGHTMTDKGPVTRSANGRGTKGRFHTEPFFVGDAAARKIIEEHPDEYAKILAETLGQIPGVTFIAPHDEVNPGAAQKGRPEFNERDFAKNVLIPALLKH